MSCAARRVFGSAGPNASTECRCPRLRSDAHESLLPVGHWVSSLDPLRPNLGEAGPTAFDVLLPGVDTTEGVRGRGAGL